MKKVALHTLGCKLNYAETSILGEQFEKHGFQLVEDHEQADLYLLNTCSVTERASRECRQIIRRFHRQSPSSVVLVVGCYAQLDPEKIASIEGVDFVLGTKEKFSIFNIIQEFKKIAISQIHVGPISELNDFGPAYSSAEGGRTRAFLKIQDGCDYSCSFCTIPLARGQSRSQSIDQCIDQANQLVRRGFKEIVLTGVNVGDYGMKNNSSLFKLLEELEGVEGLERIRVSSIEPNLLNDEIIQFVKQSKKTCKHFHIPLQNGNDDILNQMRRRYGSREYRELIEKIKIQIPDAGIGVDVIVGFPGETKEHFSETHSFLADLPVSYLHVFSYSERPNTPAIDMKNHIEPKERTRRSEVLRALSVLKKRNFYSQYVGKSLPVLWEETVQPNGSMEGFTDNYIRVRTKAVPSFFNTIAPAYIEKVDDTMCEAKIMNL